MLSQDWRGYMGATYGLDMDARKRRLDELFADEPYLSATMRASRLHEREDAIAVRGRETPRFIAEARPARLDAEPTRRAPETANLCMPQAEASVARLGFVVSVRQEPQGMRAEVNGDEADVMNPAEAARFLRIGMSTLRRWEREMGLPAAHLGRSKRYRKTAIMRWLRSRESR